jgi:serine/threonine protein kinase
MSDTSDSSTTRSHARIGLVLRDKWRLDALLGVGGMAAVYAATHTNNGRRGAIKLLHPELAVNTEVRSRFLREGYAANKVEHPGTVAVLDDDVTEDGAVYLVMELLEGETLEARRDVTGVLPPADVLPIIDKILDVLVAAHPKGIIHRDLKPDNIFLGSDGAVKVLDFGIARVREASGTGRQTMANAGPMGTPAFMPPEQARGRWSEVGPRSDLWALGATMFTLFTGRLVHEAETVNELLLAAMTKTAPPFASVMPDASPELAAIIDRALAYEQEDRWADAAAMQSALRLVLRSLVADPDGNADLDLALDAWMPEPTASALAPPPPPSLPFPAAQPLPPPSAYLAFSPTVPVPLPPPRLPTASVVTGNPVTIGPEPGATRTGSPTPPRSKTGLLVAGLLAAALGVGLGVTAFLGGFSHKLPGTVEQAGSPSPPTLPDAPPSSTAATPTLPSAQPSPSTSASVKAAPKAPVAPSKTKTKTVQTPVKPHR